MGCEILEVLNLVQLGGPFVLKIALPLNFFFFEKRALQESSLIVQLSAIVVIVVIVIHLF